MNLFKRKIFIDPLQKKEESAGRRNFFRKALAPLFGAVVLSDADELYSIESKTGYIYVKKNGEIINNYKPQSSTPFVGEICIFPYNFAPCSSTEQWTFCNGQALQINEYPGLYQMIGNFYGGDGIKTFCVPDMRGRAPVLGNFSSGFVSVGQASGQQNVTLNQSNIPRHNHLIMANDDTGNSTTPANCYPAVSKSFNFNYCAETDTTMSGQSISSYGNSLTPKPLNPVNIMQPFLGLSYCISVQGILPRRS